MSEDVPPAVMQHCTCEAQELETLTEQGWELVDNAVVDKIVYLIDEVAALRPDPNGYNPTQEQSQYIPNVPNARHNSQFAHTEVRRAVITRTMQYHLRRSTASLVPIIQAQLNSTIDRLETARTELHDEVEKCQTAQTALARVEKELHALTANYDDQKLALTASRQHVGKLEQLLTIITNQLGVTQLEELKNGEWVLKRWASVVGKDAAKTEHEAAFNAYRAAVAAGEYAAAFDIARSVASRAEQ